ncbi:hypothetical protein AAEY27_09820 [Kosakonia sp. BYX6]|uniref:Fimbrial protein n=1 Tax=Kosakonia calanthes TaxID=3139408 RepID=A0ABZ3BA34_9ENTR
MNGFPTITASLTATSDAGSNGLSLTYGGKNIYAEIECTDLPFTVKSDHLDGGKAVTIQPNLTGLSIDNIKINCRRAKNVSYGFGADINMDWLLSKK